MAKGDKLLHLMQRFLVSVDQTDRPEMREAAGSYADACNMVNDNLSACDELLKKGLLSDAIAYAESFNPPLLHMVGKLNFKEREQWVTFCHDYNWPVPSDLDLAAAKRLEEAYRSTHALRPLLEQWREIVRTGSTLAKLALARRIAALTPSNAAWIKNIAELEHDYLDALVADAKDAIEKNDCESLNDIHREMFCTGLTIQPDERVTRKIETVLNAYQAECLCAAAARLLQEINDAYSMCDREQLGHLLKRWDAFCSDAAFKPDAGSTAQVADAAKWLKEKLGELEQTKKIDSLIRDLTNALDQEFPMPEVEKIYYHLKETNADISSALDERMRTRRENWELEQSRIHRNRLVVATALAIVILVVIFGGGRLYLDWRAKTAAVSSINQALQEGHPRLAMNLVDNYLKSHPGNKADPEITRLGAMAATRKAERDRRDAEFVALLDQFNEAREIQEVESRLTQAEKLLSKAEECADQVNLEHKKQLAEMASAVAENKRLRQNAIDMRFLAACDQVLAALAKVEGTQGADVTLSAIVKIEDQFAAVLTEVERLWQSGEVTPYIKNEELKKIDVRIDSNRNWLRIAREIAGLEDYLDTFSSVENLAAVLEQYNKACTKMPARKMKYGELEKWLVAYGMVGVLQGVDNVWQAGFRQGFPHALAMIIKANPPEECIWIADLKKLQQEAEKLKSLSPEVIAAAVRQAVTELKDIAESYRAWFEMRLKKENCYYWLYTKVPSNLTFKQAKINKQPAGSATCTFMFYPILEKDTTPYKMICKAKSDDIRFDLFDIEMKPAPDEGGLPAITLRLLNPGSGYLFDNISVEPNETVSLPEARHYIEVVAAINRLESVSTVETVARAEKEVGDRLSAILQITDMHPAPRLKIVARLVKLFREISPRYADLLKAADDALGAAAAQDYDWLAPVPINSTDYRIKIEKMQSLPGSELQPFKLSQLRNDDDDTQARLLATALSRRVKPLAVIRCNADKLPSFRFMGAVLEAGSRELWMLRRTESGLEFVVVAECSDGIGKLDPEYTKNYFEGQFLFSPTDGRSTRELALEVAANSADKSRIDWPASWPVNRRNK